MVKKILAAFVLLAVFMTGCAGSNTAGSSAVSGTKDITNTTAREIVADMRVGWNLGNTLDAHGNSPEGFAWLGDGTYAGTTVGELETAWLGEGAVAATQELFDTLKEAGFNTVRIPVTWYKAADAANNYAIRADWMARVKEIVDFAVVNDMYIILNTHHDESIFKFFDGEMKEFDSLRAFELIWKQIAETFKDYNEKLIFEGLNEPRTQGSRNEWTGGTREERLNINTYNQLFVDTVRATGGNNAYRALMITPYGANSDAAAMKDLRIPKDSVRDRIIVSIHAYTPWEFALRNDEEAVDTWSRTNRGDTNQIHHMFNRIYDAFIHDGIPVIMGEMGAMNRNNIEARADWTEFYIETARKFGVPCIWWDNGLVEGDGELFGLIDRSTNEFHYPEIVRALMRATHPSGARAYDFAHQQNVGNDDVPLDEPEPEISDEPEPPREEIRIPRNESGLSLIEDEETELTTELKALVNKFWLALLPADIIEVSWVTLVGHHREYVDKGLIEDVIIDESEKFYSVENMDYVFNDIFSSHAVNIVPVYREKTNENGLIEIPTFGITEGYEFVLKEQIINEENIELYFYYFYYGVLREIFTDGSSDAEVIGRWDDGLVVYEDMLETLDIVKYTFVLEDGKYKILSIENAT
ncbi:MAG: glycoside hydrolase family 5 protein [Oscillospiraceae bacterium]|nr:glycoside hydrolase family 5 protein [Oscillospiraceae bacterium]